MIKWEIYACESLSWCRIWEYEWVFKVISRTEKTYKLERIKEWKVNTVDCRVKNPWIITWKFDNRSVNCLKMYDEYVFTIYIGRHWIPYQFLIESEYIRKWR